MLVDYPQPIFIYRENERVANLPQGFEVAKRGKSWVLIVDFECRRAAIVRNQSVLNQFSRNQFKPASYRQGCISLNGDAAFKMKSRRNWWRRRGLQGKSSNPTRSVSLQWSPYGRLRHSQGPIGGRLPLRTRAGRE